MSLPVWLKVPSSLAIAVLLSLLSTAPARAFADAQKHWASACITQMAARKLVSGYPDQSFRPNNTLTRAEFAVLMLNAFPDKPLQRRAITFKDVPSTFWAADAIKKAYEREFFSGYPGDIFQPNQPIPRVQAIAILANAVNFNPPENIPATLQRYFDDAGQIPNYAKPAIAAGTVGRLAVNYPNVRQLRPNQSTTRGEVAAFLCQSLRFSRTVPTQYIAAGDRFAVMPEMGGISPFSEGLAIAYHNNKLGFIDKTGQLVIPAQFADARPFSEGLAAVWSQEKWGYIDRSGQWIIPAQFSDLPAQFAGGMALVKQNDKYGFMDTTGKMAIAAQFDEARSFSEGVAAVKVGGQWGLINIKGEFVLPLQPYTLGSFSEGLAQITVNDKVGFIDKTGKVVIEPQFADARNFSEGRSLVRFGVSQFGNKSGYIDKTGKMVIEPQFYIAQDFSQGLAGVLFDDLGKWGFIDSTGKVVIPGQFSPPDSTTISGVNPFREGVAMVRLGEKVGFINRSGTFVIEPQLADATSFSDGLAYVNYAGRWVREINGYDSSANPVPTTSFRGGVWGYIPLPKP
jgi:hypothetical protein